MHSVEGYLVESDGTILTPNRLGLQTTVREHHVHASTDTHRVSN